MHLPKPLRHPFIIIARVIDDDGQQEGQVRIHEVTAINRQLPFETEVAFTAIMRRVRDDREEQSAGPDLLADRLVPRIPAPQLALVEPDLDAGGSQCLGNPLGRLRILRGVAEKYSARWLRHGHFIQILFVVVHAETPSDSVSYRRLSQTLADSLANSHVIAIVIRTFGLRHANN